MIQFMARLWAQAKERMGMGPSGWLNATKPRRVRHLNREDQLITLLEREDREMRRAIDLIREERNIIQGRNEERGGGPRP